MPVTSDGHTSSGSRRTHSAVDSARDARTLLFVDNTLIHFITHRLPIALAARERGYRVHLATPDNSEQVPAQIANGPIPHHRYPLSRRGLLSSGEVKSIAALYRLYRTLRPTIVHHITLKPVVYGTLAAQLAGVPLVVNAVTGLGYSFINRDAWLARSGIRLIYGPFGRSTKVHTVFQNRDDRNFFLTLGLSTRNTSSILCGTGVDLNQYKPTPEPSGPPSILLASRLLQDKGVLEFCEAAAIAKKKRPDSRFILAGDLDPGNPKSVTESMLSSIKSARSVEIRPWQADIRTLISDSHVVCLPSYREGLPRILMEAAALGRCLIATNVPGCSEVVRPGVNGYLVPPRSVNALADVFLRAIENNDERRRYSEASAELAVRSFGLMENTDRLLDLYERQIGRRASS